MKRLISAIRFRGRTRPIREPFSSHFWKRGGPIQWLPHNLGVIFPCLVLVLLAMGAAIMTINKAYGILGYALGKDFGGSGKAIEVRRVYLTRGDYLDYVPTLMRLNPGVGFALNQSDGVVTMTINDEELFPDLMMALHAVQAFKPGVAWEMVELCVRKCPEGAIARASVKGFRQEIR